MLYQCIVIQGGLRVKVVYDFGGLSRQVDIYTPSGPSAEPQTRKAKAETISSWPSNKHIFGKAEPMKNNNKLLRPT